MTPGAVSRTLLGQVEWLDPGLPAGVVCSLAPCYIPLQGPSHNVGPHRRQPLFGLIKEGVNLLHLVAKPQTGRCELLVVGLIPCQRGWPDPKRRVTKLFPEGVHLRRRVALPQTAAGLESC